MAYMKNVPKTKYSWINCFEVNYSKYSTFVI